MSQEDNDNIYVLEEEEHDDTPLNFAEYNRENIIEETKNEEKNKTSVFSILLKIMFNPVEGWKTLRRSGIKYEAFQSSCFYPLLALLALSEFAEYFYKVNVGLTEIVTKGVVSFVSFFFGYFCIPIILSWFLSKDDVEKFDDNFGKNFVMASLSTLVIFEIMTNVLPMLWPILIFLPIWTLYLMFKGVRFFKFRHENEMKFFVISGALAVGMPLLMEWALTTILPY